MSNTNENVVSVFDAFGQAYEALKKVPELEATIAQQLDTIKTDEELMALYRSEVEALKNERDLADAQRRATEEALEKARKSSVDLETRLDLVLGTFRSLSSDIAATLSVVTPEPEPEPIPEPVAEVSVPTDPTTASDTSIGTNSSTTDNPQPANSTEAAYRDSGCAWKDTNNNWHNSTGVNVPSDPTTSIPTSNASVAGPSANAPIPDVTSSATPTPAFGFDKPQEVTSTASVPFAQSTANQSPIAASTTSAPPPAPSSDTASNEADAKLPDWMYRPVGEPRWS